MFATIVTLTNVFEIDITLFVIWHNKVFDFNSDQWFVNLPRGARQPAPYVGSLTHVEGCHIMYNTQNTTILVIFVNAYVCKLYNLECMHAIIICKNNTVFAKSDFWSKTRQPAPVSPNYLEVIIQCVLTTLPVIKSVKLAAWYYDTCD